MRHTNEIVMAVLVDVCETCKFQTVCPKEDPCNTCGVNDSYYVGSNWQQRKGE